MLTFIHGAQREGVLRPGVAFGCLTFLGHGCWGKLPSRNVSMQVRIRRILRLLCSEPLTWRMVFFSGDRTINRSVVETRMTMHAQDSRGFIGTWR